MAPTNSTTDVIEDFVDGRIPVSPRAYLTLRKMTESYEQQILGSFEQMLTGLRTLPISAN